MELYQEILVHALQKKTIQVTFPDLELNAKELEKMECYRALKLIKEILDDDMLDDRDCFDYIERIIRVFETLGCKDGNRHDFG